MAPNPVVVVREEGRAPLWVVVRSTVLVGRDCDGLLLTDPGVSRRHLELRVESGRVVCTDLGSRNGTRLDGHRLVGPRTLEEGSVVTLGATTVRLAGTAADRHAARPGRSPVPPGRRDPVRRTSIGLVADDVASGTWHPGAAGETVTILFSDIEGSTRCASALGDSVWFELLDAHNRIVRSELPVTGGREVKSQGDGFMLAFASARRALDFAARTQRRVTAELAHVRGGPVRVRMGLHTGESVADATGDLFGRHVNKAARIADLAGGGQVLVSSTVREIAEGTLDAAFDQGVEVELRGLPGTHVLHRFSW